MKNGVYDMDSDIPATITSHEPGYLIKEEEKIVGLQTDVPLKQAFMPFGGIKMANNALVSNGYETDEEMTKIFTEYRKTHNQGVLMPTAEMRLARKTKSLLVFQMLMAVAVLSVTIVVSHYMVSTT